MRKRGSHKRFVYTRPSAKAIASIKERVRTMTYRHTLHHDPGYLMDYLGRVLRGWANYFRHGVVQSRPSTRSTPTRGSGSRPGCGRSTGSAGQNSGAGSACPAPGASPTTGQRFRGAASVTVIRYRYRGYRIPTPWTPNRHRHRLNSSLTWRARCGENRTPGSAGGPGKRTRGNRRHRAPGRPNWHHVSERKRGPTGR